jgi:CDP-6-deoxy-D-xylo-4-hexulose-3-dehydrase
MSAFQPGDIILLDFPFSNRQGSKYRPGLVLAPSDFNGDYIVAYITSNADLALLYSHAVFLGKEDLSMGRMVEESAVRVDKVITVAAKTIGKGPVAKLTPDKLAEVLKKWNELSTRTYSRTFHTANRPGDDPQRPAFIPGETTVPYAGRVFTEDEVQAAVSSTLDFWLTLGPEGEAFEKELAALLGVRHSLLVNSGSSANLVAFAALTTHKLPPNKRIQPGDEVITVAAGFPTTVAPIIQSGAVAVFLDNDPITGNIRAEQLEAAYSPGKTKAVMIAHALGNPFPIAAVLKFCRQHDLWLIEDNCDALGCTYSMPVELARELALDHLLKIAEAGDHPLIRFEELENRKLLTAPTGVWGDISTQSFYPPHHLTMGEGGAVNIIKHPPLKTYAESFRDWGRDCWCASGKDDTCGKRFGWQLGELPKGYDHKYIYSHLGYNLKPLDPQAAIGRQQLKKLPAFIEARKRNWEILRAGLADLEDVFEFSLPTHATAWQPPDNQQNRKPETGNLNQANPIPVSGLSSQVSNFSWDSTACRTDCSWFGFMIRVKPSAPFTHSAFAHHLDEKKIGNRMFFGGNLLRQPVFVQMRKDRPESIRLVGSHGATLPEINDSSIATAFPGADAIMNTGIFLGTYPGLTQEMLDYEIQVIGEFVKLRPR